MTADYSDPAWEALSYKEKNRVLFERQKKTLEEFLERGAISKAQSFSSFRESAGRTVVLIGIISLFRAFVIRELPPYRGMCQRISVV